MKLNLNDKGLYITNIIINSVPNLIDYVHIIEHSGEIQILTSKLKINNLLIFLKNNSLLQYKSCTDLYAVDLLDYTGLPLKLKVFKRFQVFYYLLSTLNESRILIKVNMSPFDSIDSASNLFNAAVWLEREIWDLFGLFFKNHPDLRRILTDYGFEGYALRKDFPLSGYNEILYTTELKKITFKPLELSQEYRIFDFISPWDIQNNKK